MARIGPQMLRLSRRVVEGDSICSLVDRVYRTHNGHQSRQMGYRVAHRAIRAGLIELLPDAPRGQYRLAPLGTLAARLIVRAVQSPLGDLPMESAGETEGV